MSEKNNLDTDEKRNPLDNPLVFILVLVFLIFMIVGVWFWLPNLISADCSSLEDKARRGDIFGSVNALFTGLAFAGILFTILLQRRELSLQREELRLQRQEMKASRAELAAQVAVQEKHLKALITQMKLAALNAELSRYQALLNAPDQRSMGAAYAQAMCQISMRMGAEVKTLCNELGIGETTM